MSRSCHSATFSSAGTTAPRTSAGEAGQVLGQHRVALVRHRRASPSGPAAKYSSASRTSVRCRWRISVARRSIEAATTPSAAKNAACRSRGMTWVETGSTARPSLLRDVLLDRGVDVGEGADRAGDGAGRDLGARRHQPRAVAGELGVVAGELEAEGRRLGMDAVAAADGQRVLVLAARAASAPPAAGRDRPAGCRRPACSCTAKLVSSTSREVMPWCTNRASGPTMLGEPGQEGDHIVLGDSRSIASIFSTARIGLESRHRLLPPAQIAAAASSGMTPSAACASQACASISNQMRKRFSGAQMAAICGRL